MNFDKLRILQASLTVFNQKLQAYHWNLYGSHFFQWHKQLEKLIKQVRDYTDDVAEKIRMNGKFSISSLEKALEISLIKEEKEDVSFDINHVSKSVVNDIEILLKHIELVSWNFTEQPLIDEVILGLDKAKWQFGVAIE
ncbi:Dps family protein [Mycoplasmopsis pulmonis]|uniref:Dps family protein n=1 Tax=Mycoplasmopsis pulmonis TaxID=2107 RepID=UPI002ACDA00E|nr:ferritin-like domain-containing protein [Mycoplasmopsis pulmonis]MDZ7293125.1 ferritin-like domain-containing protein [Mycoplasmopsis pulmonis]